MGSAWLGVVHIAPGLGGCVVVRRHGPVSVRCSSEQRVVCRDADAFLVTLLICGLVIAYAQDLLIRTHARGRVAF